MSLGTGEIPLMYKIVIDKLKQDCRREEMINLARARYLLRYIFRMPKEKVSSIFAEMQMMGLIEINGQEFIHFIDGEK